MSKNNLERRLENIERKLDALLRGERCSCEAARRAELEHWGCPIHGYVEVKYPWSEMEKTYEDGKSRE